MAHFPGFTQPLKLREGPADPRSLFGEGMNKVFSSCAEAVADIPNGASLAVGGFGLNGIPENLIQALYNQGATDLVTVSNNCGVDQWGLGVLLHAKRIRRTTGSYVGENKEFERQYLHGELEVELVPQGTLAERLRAGGSGIPAFFTPAGEGTLVADGGLPWRYNMDGSVALPSPKKETRIFRNPSTGIERSYVMEEAITCDFALVRASVADTAGNIIFHKSTRNFNPLCAMAARIAIVETEELVEAGEIDPEHVHLPGIFVQRIVRVGAEGKRIERVTTRKRPEGK